MHFQKILTKRTTPKKMEYFEKVRAAKRELFQRRVLMSRAPMRYLLTALFYLGFFFFSFLFSFFFFFFFFFLFGSDFFIGDFFFFPSQFLM